MSEYFLHSFQLFQFNIIVEKLPVYFKSCVQIQINAIGCYLWYLSQKLVLLAFFSDRVGVETNQRWCYVSLELLPMKRLIEQQNDNDYLKKQSVFLFFKILNLNTTFMKILVPGKILMCRQKDLLDCSEF